MTSHDPALRVLATRIAELNARLDASVTNADELGRLMVHAYRTIFDSDMDGATPAALKQHAAGLRQHLFDLRRRFRQQIGIWHAAGLMTHANQTLARDCLRASRFASDMLGEVAIDNSKLADGETPLKAFRGAGNTLVAPEFDSDDGASFKTGDVVLVRGLHHNSAAIARIGDVDSQFSHVGIIHVDDDGRQWMVESLIEDGAVINPLGHALQHGNGRALLFRHPDANLAAEAARIAYTHVRRTYGTWKRRILYDFTMQLDDRRPLFCSKLVRLAYARASKGTVLLPTFTTKFTMKNRDFIDRIGVKAAETYAPGDTEIEPRFALVAEWADHRVTARLRAQDLIMVKLFDWMETYGYTFEQDMLIRVVSLLGRLSAHFSEDIKAILAQSVPKVPINMPRKTVAAVAMLHKTAEPLLAEIARIEAEHIARTGLPLHPRRILAALDAIHAREGKRIGYLVAQGG